MKNTVTRISFQFCVRWKIVFDKIIIIQLVIAFDLREYLSVDFIVVFAWFFSFFVYTWDCVYMIKWPMTLIWLKYQINASTLAYTLKKIALLSLFIFARNVDINHSQIHSSKNISKKASYILIIMLSQTVRIMMMCKEPTANNSHISTQGWTCELWTEKKENKFCWNLLWMHIIHSWHDNVQMFGIKKRYILQNNIIQVLAQKCTWKTC